MPELIRQARQRLDAGEAIVLVTVAQSRGSTPRNAGTRMLVSQTRQWQTIGGGHLEWKAAALARELIANHGFGKSVRQVEHYPLGPSLGQCCGGAVTLVFELLGTTDLPWLEELASILSQGKTAQRRVGFGQVENTAVSLLELDRPSTEITFDQPSEETRWFVDELAPPSMHVVLFGAGHVGKALIHFLGSLQCTVTWVDERESEFPEFIPSNVQVDMTDTPEEAVDQAPANSYYVVMTHRHDLDQRLCQLILQRNDFCYAGLIGSKTKRNQFERRFRQRGISEEVINSLVCPIGIDGINSKDPAAIAVSITAELLRLNELHITKNI
ncbi:xanthine dehydrogenase accessory protein XdhC [Paenalcaligenes niemegkensis]|uniref:xanthine dehydrogenase accessory protein XdhC n=1 Tax=Paenalcaligenes niemegkensis TaxID=2895469 RepID=UPI001EE790FC|nr:xanthine dehydrogenase accessory protein XdhC [Paenalcaligenes niemegkensis]MCQ9616716.1 xanthine dehydrogenase accessory protein XdhC [Paenalcaligenes niemegkensis]